MQIRELTDEELKKKLLFLFSRLMERLHLITKPQSTIPWWIYVIGGVLLVIIGLLVFLFIRETEEDEDDIR